MNIRISLNRSLRQTVTERLQDAYRGGQVRLVRRIHALLCVIEGKPVDEVAALLNLGAQTIRDYVNGFLYRGVVTLTYQKPPGRPTKLTRAQRKELPALIKAGPEAAGYTTGCLSAVLIQDLNLHTFGVQVHPHYICALLKQLGFSF
jgi:transposase